MMIYLVQSERSFRLRVENPSGISEVESFRFQPVLHSNEIVISLGQDHAADSERGDSNQRSLRNCRIAPISGKAPAPFPCVGNQTVVEARQASPVQGE